MAQQSRKERLSPLFFFVSFLVLSTSVLGGVNTNAEPTNVVLQYITAPIVPLAMYQLAREPGLAPGARRALWLLGAFLLVPLLQLAPLPEALWRGLPFRDIVASVLRLLDAPHAGGPVSLSPFLTMVSSLTLAPSLAIFLTVLTLNARERGLIVAAVVVAAIAGAVLGLLQLSQNSPQGAYLYPDMQAGDVVGFFANRNHFAAQMYALIPFSVAGMMMSLAPAPRARGRESRRRNNAPAAQSFLSAVDLPLFFAAATTFFALIVACVMASSRAGVVLLMAALLAASALPRWRDLQSTLSNVSAFSKAAMAFAGFCLLFALEFGFVRLLARFDADPLQDARLTIAKNTLAAAVSALPTGTGLGTFQRIYAAVEPSRDVFPYAFVNHAHNEYLELFLEAGLPGLLIVVSFLIWFWRRARAMWQDPQASYLSRAAVLSIALLLLHSAVDYPLRTHALMAFFALCCALLLPAPPAVDPASRVRLEEAGGVD